MKQFYISIILVLVSLNSFAQIRITKAKKVKDLIQKNFSGADLEITKVRYRGKKKAIGQFKNGELIGMNEGIILSTGNVKKALGPNKGSSTTGKNFSRGDRYLSKLAKTRTKDAVIIEFDFIPKAEYLSFNFVFASEEYNEYVGSRYNDVFAFALSTKGRKPKNLAKIPGTGTKISINRVNYKKNSEYYVNNSPLFFKGEPIDADTILFAMDGINYMVIEQKNVKAAIVKRPKHNIEFDGFTKVLQAKAKVKPNKKYHLRIAIADAGDRILDSGVFIEYGSFNSHKDPDYKYGKLNDAPDYYIERDTVEVVKKDSIIRTDSVHTVYEYIRDTVYFRSNAHRITQGVARRLTQLMKKIPSEEIVELKISGYTDAKGTRADNKKLSKKRADTIQQFLLEKGVSKDVIHQVIAMGEIGVGKEERKNRRVEIEIKIEKRTTFVNEELVSY
jgi:outer membrane protein OmpA-like peptidoglycan-associated protein